MVMITHAGKLGPLGEEMVQQGTKTGSGSCSMEQIILKRARSFSLKVPTLDLIGPTVYGDDPVKRSILDFYPQLYSDKGLVRSTQAMLDAMRDAPHSNHEQTPPGDRSEEHVTFSKATI